MSERLHLISAGAAKGLVEALRQETEHSMGCMIEAQFGAVGAMKDALLGGAPCDVVILTQKMLEDLARDDLVDAETIRPLGRVHTAIAVPAGAAHPPIGDAEVLAHALSGASAIYFPDPQRATAGIHFAKVLAQLGLSEALASRLRPFPNGATAMRAMADDADANAIGCTQATEILYTPGVELVGRLPKAFELSTLYSASICTRVQSPEPAQRLMELLTGDATEALRRKGGFEAA